MQLREIPTFPLIATGRCIIPCIPSMADCGRLMIGIDSMEPNTPPLLIVNVPPCMSAGVSWPAKHEGSFISAVKK